MANEKFLGAGLVNATAGELLDYVEGSLRASNAITDGGPDGLFRSLDYRRNGQIEDGKGRWSPKDSVRALDVRATYANQVPVARKILGNEQPRSLHMLVETGSRYDGSTGLRAMAGLARLTVAMTLIAAEKAAVPTQLIMVDESNKLRFTEEKQVDAAWSLAEYDEYMNARQSHKRSARKTAALTEGLYHLSEFGPRSESDMAMVISDFTSGAERDKQGSLTNFSWKKPLNRLQQSLGDRLYTLRLTSPSQVELPRVATYSGNDGVTAYDADEYLRHSERYAVMGEEKSLLIGNSLKVGRTVTMDTQDKAPFITASDFIFGAPEQQ